MTKKTPAHLKLISPEVNAPSRSVDGVDAVWQAACAAFENLTGWAIELLSEPLAASRSANLMWSIPANPGVGVPPRHFRLVPRSGEARTSSFSDPLLVRALAEPLTALLAERDRAHHALWQREAELAACVPVVSRPDEGEQLANRLEAILCSGATSINTHAAAMYLLDDATRELKLRACWGLPRTKLLEPARPLQGALADLEALLGHAVVLNDPRMFRYWRSPEDFGAAVCVPISTPSTPLGTLWVFSKTAREFSDRETGIVEMMAGRIAAEMERETLLADASSQRAIQRKMLETAKTHRRRNSLPGPMIPGWQMFGTAHQAGEFGGAYYDWNALPQERVMLVGGVAASSGLEASLTAATLRAAARASQKASPEQVIASVNNVLWAGSMGDEPASMLSLLAQPGNAPLEWSSAGEVFVAKLSPNGAARLDVPAAQLGVTGSLRVAKQTTQLEMGETLLVVSIRPERQRRVNWADGLFEFAQQHLNDSLSELMTAIQRWLPDSFAPQEIPSYYLGLIRRSTT